MHSHFSELPRFLDEGDLVVINTSGTLAAAVPGVDRAGRDVEVHFSTCLPADLWTVELRRGDEPWFGARPGDVIELDGGGRVELLTPYAAHARGVRLWVTLVTTPEALHTYLAVHGHPIRYGYVRGSWPISTYQNVYATEPGSAEMPSAGRPFTPEVLTRLVARGVGVAPIVLHTGVASLEASEPPYPEYYQVTRATAHRVNDTRREGGRVIAIGTTVVRALADGGGPEGRGARRQRMDRHDRHPGPPGNVCRRDAHRLARARGVTPRHAGGDRRPGRPRALLCRGDRRGILCGTNSATSI